MLKPVSILALDDRSAALAEAVQSRVSAAYGLEDLVQWRRVTASLDEVIDSIHAQRQRPDSPLRLHDDLSTRELVLVIVDSTGEARLPLVETLGRIRHIYEMRRLASFFALDVLCLLPELVGTTSSDDYAAAYGLMKALSAAAPRPFDEAWLLDATNASRVKFPPLGAALDLHADAVAGILMFEPEMSGALPGSHPRGMPPVFSAFGFADLVFPRDAALARVESRFAAECIRENLLRRTAGDGEAAPLRAKQFVVGNEFAIPFSRIGIEAGQSLFHRFQPKAHVSDNTRSAEEVIAACRAELRVHRESIQLDNLATLTKQGEEVASGSVLLLTRVVDETLDRADYPGATAFLEALLDPLADVRSEIDVTPRNLVTEISTATAALDARLRFTPTVSQSDAARKRVRELGSLVKDQKLVAETVGPAGAEEQITAWETERDTLLQALPDAVFKEEAENNAGRNAARDAESTRLKSETEGREQQLRELFAQLPRAEQSLREALEERRLWLWRTVIWAAAGLTALYGVPFAFGVLRENLERINWAAGLGLIIYAVWSAVRYARMIAPAVRDARDLLQRLKQHIAVADKAKNTAYNDELQFEYDVAHRRATLMALRRSHEAARRTLDALRARFKEIEDLAATMVPASISTTGLAVAVVDDADVDAWYELTEPDRAPFLREFPISRSESSHCAISDLQARLDSHVAAAFDDLRRMTLASAASTLAQEAKLAQRLKRFAEMSAPRIEIRDDDLLAQQTIQRDTTLWMDSSDARWTGRIQYRFPDAQPKASDDATRVHALTRTLHFPAYVIGQIDYYRAQYEAAKNPDFSEAPDLLPMELALGPAVRAAYEQILLARATGVVQLGADGRFSTNGVDLGDSHLTAAQKLAAADAVSIRQQLTFALESRLSVTTEVERGLRQLQQSGALSSIDRGVLNGLIRRYAPLL
jgi:hypothetical protein